MGDDTQDVPAGVDTGMIRALLTHIDLPAPDAGFVRGLRDLLIRSLPAT